MKGSSWHRSLFRFLSLTAVILSSLVTEYHAGALSEAAASNPPELIVAQGINDTTIELTWMAATGASSYAIYRGGALLTSQPGTLFKDASLTPATTYSYQVSAFVGGVESPRSMMVSAKTQASEDSALPTQPGGITAFNITSNGATLTWAASTDNTKVVGYRILRGAAGAPLSALVQVATTEGTTVYTAANLRAATTYQFAVRAFDAYNNLSTVRTVTFTTASSSDVTAPSAPSSSSVSAIVFSSSRIDLTWSASTSSDISGYQVFRDGTLVGEVYLPLRRYYSDNGIAPASTHSYQIRTIDSAGNVSALTTARNATTTATGVVKIMRGPYIQWSTATSTRIAWWTNIPASSVVNYGVGSLAKQVSDPILTMQHVMLLGGLTAGVTYTYQVVSGSASSAVLTFTTAAPAGSPFTFAAVGDFGGGSSQEGQIATNIANGGTQFVQTLGDNVYPDSQDPNFSTNYSDFDSRFYKPYAATMGKKTLWLGGGNHEYYGDEAFWQNFWMPNNERWYSYDWGDAHILVLDTEQPFTSVSAQYQFAVADLSASQSKIWRIVVLHRPPYSSSGTSSSSTSVRTYLVPLFEQQNVQLVLTGHSHNYERTYPLLGGVPQVSGGVTYIVSGGGGNGLNQFTISQPSWSAFRQASYEYMRISVSPSSLQVDAITETGAIIDSATITAGSGTTPTNTHTPTTTPTSTRTQTVVPTLTFTPTRTPNLTLTSTRTPTVPPSNTVTQTVVPTVTLTPTRTSTPTATYTPAPTSQMPVFSDGFESGNMSSWTSSAGLAVQTALVHSGNFAAQGNATNGATYAKKTLPASYSDGYARIYFNLVSYSSQVNLLRYRTSTDTSIGYLFVSTTGKLSLRNDVTATTITSTTSVGNGWHALEFHVVSNGALSTTEVWLDGVRINDLSITTDLGINLIGRLQIGEVQTGRTYNVSFDDIVFDIQRIGP